MPTYEVQMADGTTYDVDAPDDAALKSAVGRLKTAHATQRARAKMQEVQAAQQNGTAKPEYSPTDVPWTD